MRIVLLLVFLLAVSLTTVSARCPRFRWGDPDCPLSLQLSPTFTRVISAAEFRQRSCCIRKAQVDPEYIVHIVPQLTELSSDRNTVLIPNVHNPYTTASLAVMAGSRIFASASGSWDVYSHQQVPEGIERVNFAYENMYRLLRSVGAYPEDFVQLTVLAKGTESALFNDFRVRANNLTTATYGSVQVTLPGREFIGVAAIEGASGAPEAQNSFSTVGEFYLSCSGLERWNLPCNVTQSIATIVTQTPETQDGNNRFLTNRIRAFIPNGTLPNGCPNWVSPPILDRAKVAWDNIITREGVYLNSKPGLVGRVTVDRIIRAEAWTTSYATYGNDTLSKIVQYLGPDKYPVLRFLQVQNLAQQDVYELGLNYWTGTGNLVYNVNYPFTPFGPYSNAIRAGDYIYTTAFGGHNASRVLVPLADRVRQAYKNMFDAAGALGARVTDLAFAEAVTDNLTRDDPLVDAAMFQFYGSGPYPARAFYQQPLADYFGSTFTVCGIFYSPLCRD